MGGVLTLRLAQSAFGPDGAARRPAPPPSDKWRLMSNQDNRVTRISEVSMASSPGGSNLCTGGTVSTNSGGTAANALDSNNATYWESNLAGSAPAQHYWQYTFASPVSIVEIKLTTPATANCPLTLQVQYWDSTNSRWVDSYMIGGEPGTWTANVSRTFTFPAANYAWRITNLFALNTGFNLSELRMKATGGGSNLCSGGAGIASIDNGQFSLYASYAFDGTTTNDSLLWAAFGEQNYFSLGYEFGSAVSVVAEIDIVSRNNTGFASTPFEYTLERWNGSYWAFGGACNTAAFTAAVQTRTATVAQADASKKAWRLRLLTIQSNSEYSIQEIQFRTALGGSTVTTGGAAFATSYNRTSTISAASAFDANSSTFWNSEAIASQGYDDICIGYVMPSAQNVVQVALTATTGGASAMPTSFVVEYWDPSIDQWVESWTVSSTAVWTAGLTQVFTHP